MTDWTQGQTPLGQSINEYSSSQTLGSDNYMVLVDASSVPVTITLPAASSNTKRQYTIKKIDSSGNRVTVDANASETIDGEETIVLSLQYSYITIVCDGTEWFIIGGEYVKMEDKLDDLIEEQQDTTKVIKHTLLSLKRIEKHLEHETEIEIDEDEAMDEVMEQLDNEAFDEGED